MKTYNSNEVAALFIGGIILGFFFGIFVVGSLQALM